MCNFNERGLLCFWSNLKHHPVCPHGPTLLFGKYINGKLEKFYLCSAFRDSNLCTFFMPRSLPLSSNDKLPRKKQSEFGNQNKKNKLLQFYNHRKLYLRFNQILSAVQPSDRIYCHTCNQLIFTWEETKHGNHDLQKSLTNFQMSHPTTFLKPLNNTKKEAQYFFSEQSTKDLAEILLKLKAKYVLCIGVPRLYEYILHHFQNEMSCLLLDFDGRFHNFFGPLHFGWYNLFNHHFFNHESKILFKHFLTQSNADKEDLYLVCDPPFGGRLEPISQTLKHISDKYKQWNNLKSTDRELKIMFIFPYFMESLIKLKSNPPGVAGGLSTLQMTDYQVQYDNHPIFQDKSTVSPVSSKQTKKFSPVRLFTNVPLNLINLAKVDGYKYCTMCERWVASGQNHCDKCDQCTSKNGKPYTHCNLCKRCVKYTWEHCEICKRCTLKKHNCHLPQSTVIEHIKKDCKKRKEYLDCTLSLEYCSPKRKRKKKTNQL